jgi:hypothetical protein
LRPIGAAKRRSTVEDFTHHQIVATGDEDDLELCMGQLGAYVPRTSASMKLHDYPHGLRRGRDSVNVHVFASAKSVETLLRVLRRNYPALAFESRIV